MPEKKIYLVALIFLVTSCADTWDSVKRGLTGSKAKSADEFLVKKKDPLILPPDFESLPTPSERTIATEELFNIEKTLQKTTSENSTESTSSFNSVEESIIEKIKKN